MSTFILHDHYTDPETGRISSYFCRLFILVGRESLQYCILDTEKNTFIALADYRMPAPPRSPEIFYTQLGLLLSEDEMLLKKYPSVVIGIDTPLHTLIPAPLFDPGRVTEYLEFNFRLPEGCQVRSDRVEEIDAYNIYGFLQQPANIISGNFSEAAVVHRSSALIKAVYQLYKINPQLSGIFLHAREQFIDLIFFEGSRPAFFNSFPCQSKEDLLYFTLYTFEQLKLRPDAVQLFLSGNIDPGTDSYLLLEQYIREISFTGRLSSLNYSAALDQAPAHRYQELFALALCGS
jgi:hypothetical protein